jgi:RNA polymerase sigma-70 factor (ECF subfamily)
MITKDILIQLVKACQKGDEKAQATFYAHYKKRMMGICRRYARTTFEAEDIFQEAFIKVFLKIGTVQDPGGPGR